MGFCNLRHKLHEMSKGKFIVFEGADGTGKSTHVKMLVEYLHTKGIDVVLTEEPTKGEIGKEIREVLGDKKDATPKKLTELFTQDRKEHVENVISPMLEKGKIVICDRYYYSTIAYQSTQGVDKDWISELNSFVPEPDLVVVITISPEEAQTRMHHREKEVFEVLHFQEKVQAELLALANGDHKKLSVPGKKWEVVSNVEDANTVQKKIQELVEKTLQ